MDFMKWVYTLLHPLSETQELAVSQHFNDFLNQWKSHGDKVYGEIFIEHKQFIVIKNTENGASPSGCSIDGMKHAVERILKAQGAEWAENGKVFYRNSEGEIQSADFREIPTLIAKAELSAQTKVFDYITSNGETDLQHSWMRRYL